MSGWKHSSTKTILAGVVSLKSRLYSQNQFLYISIGSGTVFIFFWGSECIMQVQNVSFKANYLHSIRLEKINNEKTQKAALVELDPKSELDNSSIQQIIYDWGGINSYSYDIAYNMGQILCELNDESMPTPRFFAITEQRSNFNKLVPESILALAETTSMKDNVINIDFLETNIDQAYNAKNAKFQHIGTTMLDYLKTLFSGKTLELNATNESMSFYIKNGFVKKSGNFNRLMFKA